MRFTFLQPTRRSLLDRLREIEIDARMRRTLTIFIITIGVVVFAEGIEQVRLSQACAMERDRLSHLQNDERRMVDLRAAANAVANLSSAAASVRATNRSGDRKAAEFSEITASLPEHLWLTSIHEDVSGLALRGGARSYALIGDAMERLAHGRTANAPVLVSSGVRDNLHPDMLEYEIRLQERAR